MAQIVLDSEAFKALSSDTRLQILKALDARPLTVSELGRFLSLNKATVFEHLKQLSGADLVKKKDDEGRKWVYYKLTWKGRNVVHPENVQFMLLLGTAVLSVGGLVAQMFQLFQRFGEKPTLDETGPSQPAPSPSPSANPEAAAAPAGGQGAPSSSAPASSSSSPPSQAEDRASMTAPPEDGAQPVLAPADSSAKGNDLLNDPNLWLLILLSILLLITTVYVLQYLSERRRGRAEVRRKIETAPPSPDEPQVP